MIWFSRVLIPLAVNAGEIGKLACSICSTDGRNDLHRAPLFVLSHSLCHFAIPSFIISVAIVLFVVFSYSTFNSAASAAAAFASLSASSFPSIPMCDFTQPKWIVQFCLVSRIFFPIPAINGVCIELFLKESKVTWLSVYIATVLFFWSGRTGSSSKLN